MQLHEGCSNSLYTVRSPFSARFHDVLVLDIELLESKATIQKNSNGTFTAMYGWCYMQKMGSLLQKPSPPIAMQFEASALIVMGTGLTGHYVSDGNKIVRHFEMFDN